MLQGALTCRLFYWWRPFRAGLDTLLGERLRGDFLRLFLGGGSRDNDRSVETCFFFFFLAGEFLAGEGDLDGETYFRFFFFTVFTGEGEGDRFGGESDLSGMSRFFFFFLAGGGVGDRGESDRFGAKATSISFSSSRSAPAPESSRFHAQRASFCADCDCDCDCDCDLDSPGPSIHPATSSSVAPLAMAPRTLR